MNKVINVYMGKLTSHRLYEISKTTYNYNYLLYLIPKPENLPKHPMPFPDSFLVAVFRHTAYAVRYQTAHLWIFALNDPFLHVALLCSLNKS